MAARVLVTGCGGTGLGAAVIQALACGEPGRWEIVACDAHPFSWGLYAAGCGVKFGELLPWAGDPGYLDAVRGLIAAYEPVAVIPGTEAETVLLAERRADLGVPVITNDAGLMPLMRDKLAAKDTLAGLGLRGVPSFHWPHRWAAAAEFGFPLVVKPSRETSGSRGVFLARDWPELDALAPLVDAGKAPVVQPYLGDCRDEYSVMVLTGRDAELIDSFVIHRELTGFSLREEKRWRGRRLAVSTGYTQGVVRRVPEIQGFAEDLAKRLGSRGPLDLQLRMVGGEPWVFEVQPRFSFSAPIRASAGFSEPDVLLRNFVYGERFGRLGYRADVAAIRAFTHLLVPVERMAGQR